MSESAKLCKIIRYVQVFYQEPFLYILDIKIGVDRRERRIKRSIKSKARENERNAIKGPRSFW